MVNIGLLSSKFSGYSMRRILEESKNLKQNMVRLSSGSLCLFVEKDLDYHIHRNNSPLDVVLPRRGGIHMDFLMLVLRHLEKMGIPIVNNHETITICKNKYLTSLALKKKRVPQPNSALAFSEKDILKHIKKMEKPLVLKLIDKSYGKGVSRINDDIEAEDWFETIVRFDSPIYIQEYIPQPGEDYRLLIVGNKVVGAMKRIAKPGEWKANISLGGTPQPYKPTKEVEEVAIKAGEAVKADICGVDLMIHNQEPKVIEVNDNPMFQGLEKVSKNIAREIVKYTIKKARK